MNYQDLMNIIEHSTQADWLHDDERGVWTYKHDLMIHFKKDGNEDEEDEEGREERKFHEPWAQQFPDPAAYRVTYTIYYGNSFVQAVIAVAVDGFRTIIPLPRLRGDLVISQWQYRFGKILETNPHSPYSLDAQMEHAGIRVAV